MLETSHIKLLEEWRARIAEKFPATREVDRFYSDGIISGNPSEWSRREKRIVFISKEPNDRLGLGKSCNWDLPTLFRNSQAVPESKFIQRNRFEKNLGRWAFAILHSSESGVPTYDEAKDQSELLHCAVINLKKTGGAGSCDEENLRLHFELFSDLFKTQLELLCPNLIICCGRTTCELLFSKFSNLVQHSPTVYRDKAASWIKQSHPSRLGRSDQSIYDEMAGNLIALSRTLTVGAK